MEWNETRSRPDCIGQSIGRTTKPLNFHRRNTLLDSPIMPHTDAVSKPTRPQSTDAASIMRLLNKTADDRIVKLYHRLIKELTTETCSALRFSHVCNPAEAVRSHDSMLTTRCINIPLVCNLFECEILRDPTGPHRLRPMPCESEDMQSRRGCHERYSSS